MLIYLLKATLVWAACLALFELLFRKVPAHKANRAYLLGALAAGLILPLLSLNVPDSVRPALPVQRVAIAWSNSNTKTTLLSANTTETPRPASTLRMEDLVLPSWLAGAGVSFFLLLLQARRILLLNRRGTKTRGSGFTLVETGVPHGPFSFLTRVFIQHRQAFPPAEWRMVLAHETCHVRQKHSVDVLVLAFLKVLLWFHPVVYWYSRRLRMVHEFEADAATTGTPAEYGRFLLEQSSLISTPSLSLAFFHSPIKSRIFMLFRRSSALQQASYLAIIPVLSVLLLCCTREQPADSKRSGNRTQNGANVFEMSDLMQQPIMFQLGDSGKAEKSFMSVLPRPVKMNGETIYESDELTKAPTYRGNARSITEDLFDRIKPSLEKLEDGGYVLNVPSIVVDNTGEIVYQSEGDFFSSVESITIAGDGTEAGDSAFQFKDGVISLRLPKHSAAKPDMNDNIRRDIISTMHEALAKQIRFAPGELNGKPVITYLGSALEVGSAGSRSDKFSLLAHGPTVIVVEDGKPRLAEIPQ